MSLQVLFANSCCAILCLGVTVLKDGSPTASVGGIGPFKLLATRRYVLDNEVTVAELAPAAVMAPAVQHPLVWRAAEDAPSVAFEAGALRLKAGDRAAEGAYFVSGWLPAGNYSADVESLSSGAAAELVWRDEGADVLLRVRAEPGVPVAFEERVGGKIVPAKFSNPQIVPPPPFRLSGVVAGPTMLIAAQKDGVVTFLGAATFAEAPDLRARNCLRGIRFGTS